MMTNQVSFYPQFDELEGEYYGFEIIIKKKSGIMNIIIPITYNEHESFSNFPKWLENWLLSRI